MVDTTKAEGGTSVVADIIAKMFCVALGALALLAVIVSQNTEEDNVHYTKYEFLASMVADPTAENGVYTNEDGEGVSILSGIKSLSFSINGNHEVTVNTQQFTGWEILYYSKRFEFGYDECSALNNVIVEVLPDSRIEVREPISKDDGASMSDNLDTEQFLHCLRFALHKVQYNLSKNQEFLEKQQARKVGWAEVAK